MKTKFLSITALVAFAFLMLSYTKPGNEESKAFNSRTYTLKELKQTFGDNIVLEGKVNLESLATVTIFSSANPCAGSQMQPCDAAENQARAYAQHLANSCCCTVTYGWECCDPRTGGSTAVLFFTEPTNCH